MVATAVLAAVFAAAICEAGPLENWDTTIKSARMLMLQGRYKEAEAQSREALKLAQRIDPKGTETAVSWNGLGLIRQYRGDAGQAETCLQRARDIFLKMDGVAIQQLSRPSNNLATLYLDENRLDKLRKLGLEEIAERLRAEKQNYPDLPITLENIAGMKFLEQNLDEASELYAEAMELRIAKAGPESIDVADVLHNVAVVRFRQNRPKDAEECLLKCLRIWGEHPDYRSPTLAIARANLGLIYATAGREEEADRMYSEGIRLAEEVFGREHRRTANVLNSYAVALKMMKRKKEGRQMEERARLIRENTRVFDVGSTVTYSDLLPQAHR